MLTTQTIRETIARSGIDPYLVTEFTEDGGGFILPGLKIYLDDQDPTDVGWAYREAQGFDASTMEWDGAESGGLDSLDQLARHVDDARLRMFRAEGLTADESIKGAHVTFTSRDPPLLPCDVWPGGGAE